MTITQKLHISINRTDKSKIVTDVLQPVGTSFI